MRSLALSLLALPLVGLLPSPAAPPTLPAGPGGVLHAHERLLRAVDAGDAPAVAALLAPTHAGAGWTPDDAFGPPPPFRAFVPSATDDPTTDSVDDAVARLLAWGDGWTTRLVTAWTDCPSEHASWGTFELERTRSTSDGPPRAERWRLTSLVAHGDTGWQIFHLHLSPATSESSDA